MCFVGTWSLRVNTFSTRIRTWSSKGYTTEDEFADFEMMKEGGVGDAGADGMKGWRFDDFEGGEFAFTGSRWFNSWL